jgi:hypothetical protein
MMMIKQALRKSIACQTEQENGAIDDQPEMKAKNAICPEEIG